MAINVKVSGGPRVNAVIPSNASQKVSSATVFQGASNSDVTAAAAYNQANSAYSQANSAYSLANSSVLLVDAGTF